MPKQPLLTLILTLAILCLIFLGCSSDPDPARAVVYEVPMIENRHYTSGWSVKATDSIWQPWAEYGTPQRWDDTARCRQVFIALAILDTIAIPDDSTRRADLLANAFDLSVEEAKGLCTERPCDVKRLDLDGTPPDDVALLRDSKRLVNCYDYKVAVRRHDTITFQDLAGCWRGVENMMERAAELETDSLFRSASGYDNWLVRSDGADRAYVLMHNNCFWPGGGGLSVPIADFPVPYFWDGEKLAFTLNHANAFYTRLDTASQYLHDDDERLILFGIERTLSALQAAASVGQHP
ncbi:MAG: hypothetical protein GF341_04955 [candidate division Zixibacteria bacterium]|nr:hypothetical protein [candidate division Zixibacteria bacterium]